MSDEKSVWRKSSYSVPDDCVELTFIGDAVWVRDSKNRDGQILAIPVKNWTRLLDQLRRSR